MDRKHNETIECEVMKWYGWGSPIGLSVFFVALAFCAALVRYAIVGNP